MLIATGVIVGLLILAAGNMLSWLAGFFLIGVGNELAIRGVSKPAKSLGAGAVWVSGILTLAAGPLASLWLAIFTGVSIIGA
ncbi:hypothetical protein GCM10009700_35050 [Brevibacterium sanguinis]|uniref:hypothetical protein n=1 Tax=Brevibacterium sanguinis TaxID=232444 RepID=UPI0031D2EEF0